MNELHEQRHANNQILFLEYEKFDKLIRAKDEIISYLTDEKISFLEINSLLLRRE
jgi:hypothetical protein